MDPAQRHYFMFSCVVVLINTDFHLSHIISFKSHQITIQNTHIWKIPAVSLVHSGLLPLITWVTCLRRSQTRVRRLSTWVENPSWRTSVDLRLRRPPNFGSANFGSLNPGSGRRRKHSEGVYPVNGGPWWYLAAPGGIRWYYSWSGGTVLWPATTADPSGFARGDRL